MRTLKSEIEFGSKNAVNKKKIITHYIYNGTSTIPELARTLDLSVPTVTKMINEMCEEGYIIDYGKLETSSGRHPNLYGLNPRSGYFVGVDIRRFNVNIGLMDFKGEMVKTRMNVPYDFDNTPQSLEELVDIIKKFVAGSAINPEHILNICVSISGRVNPESGYSFSTFNFSERPLADILCEKTGMPVCIDNDTRIMAYGEYMNGCVKGERDVIFVNMGWGLGIGIIIDGKTYKGKSGFAGEFGHFSVYNNEIICHCGKKGCIETEVSGKALHRKLIERVRDGETSVLSSIIEKDAGSLTLDHIIDAVNREDPLCIDIVENVGRELGKHIAGLINIFNPELVIIGGTLSETGDYIIQPVITAIKKYSLNLVNRDSEVRVSILGQRAGFVGACMQARSALMEA